MKILITNARIVNEGQIFESDVLIEKGHIATIAKDLSSVNADKIIDAKGKYVLPGMIDDQVHFRTPGLTHKADIASESRAAVAGGVTSFMDMPNTKPACLNLEALEEKYQIAAETSVANYAFYLGASNDNLEEIKKIKVNQACGIKVFMGASTGNMLVDNPEILEEIFSSAPLLIATHCEDTPTILANEKIYQEKYQEDVPVEMHPYIRSREACLKSSSFAVALAQKHNTRLHVLHITTKEEVNLFNTLPLAQKQITAEACIHHLLLEESTYKTKGNFIKCNPAIKSKADRDAIIQGVIDGRLDLIGTDHAPHTLEEKQQKYVKAPAGLAYIQHSLPGLLSLYHQNLFSLELIAEKTAHNVAKRFNIEKRGFIREGYWADLVLIDLENKQKVLRENIYHKCGWSAFEGEEYSSVEMTMVSGNIVYENGQLFDIKGKRLVFL